MPTVITYQVLPTCPEDGSPSTPGSGLNILRQVYGPEDGDTLLWTENNGDLPVDLATSIIVTANGNVLNYPDQYTITPNSGPGQSTFTITYPFPGAYYEIRAFYYA